MNRVPVDVGEVASSLANASATDIAAKQIALEVEVQKNVVCNGDRVRIDQIVWNLLSNAIKLTPKGGRICVRVGTEGDFAKVTVSDTGCGIEPDFLSQVFSMFSQVSVGATPANGGLGIELALVQGLARAHGGRVEATSAGLGQGAQFTVWLPLRVLAVDDFADGLFPFAGLLRLEGPIVDVADSAGKAIAMLEANAYDLLISDLGMPEMDGYELIAELRHRPATQHLRAIAMSGFGRPADVRRALKAGFNAHAPKPAAIGDLKAAIGRL